MILFNTGPIVAAAAENDEHFHISSQLFTGLRLAGRRLPLPATVAAEVGYLLSERVSPSVEVQFLQGVADGAFELVDLTREDYRRTAELTEQYTSHHRGGTSCLSNADAGGTTPPTRPSESLRR